MRIAKTLDDLPVGTPIEVEGCRITWKGLVIENGWMYRYREFYVKVLFPDGTDVFYFEEDLEEEQIRIVEVK